MNTNDDLRQLIGADIEEVLETSNVENKRIGKYEVGSEIGKGGMGAVYLAKDTGLGRTVVIKMIHFPSKEPEHCKMMIARFRREAQAAAKVPHHPNVVGVVAFDEIDGRHLLVMERVYGRTLRDELLGEDGKFRALEPRKAVRIVVEVLRGLEAIHAARIVHRDMKPGNIMLTYTGDHAKILDFGLGKAMESFSDPALDMTLTQVGTPLGSPLYMSPEQTKSLPVDERTDLYSVGVILFQLLTGKPPFTGQNAMEIYQKHCSAPVPPIVVPPGTLPSGLEAVVRKAMAKAVKDRFSSATEMRTALEAVMAVPASKPVTVVAPKPRGSFRRFAPLAVLALLGLMAFALMPKDRQDPAPRAPETVVKTVAVVDVDAAKPAKAPEGISIPPPPPPAEATAAQGCELYRQGRTSDAIATLTRALTSGSDAEGLYCLCGAYVRQPESAADARKACNAYLTHPQRDAGKAKQVREAWLKRIGR